MAVPVHDLFSLGALVLVIYEAKGILTTHRKILETTAYTRMLALSNPAQLAEQLCATNNRLQACHWKIELRVPTDLGEQRAANYESLCDHLRGATFAPSRYYRLSIECKLLFTYWREAYLAPVFEVKSP